MNIPEITEAIVGIESIVDLHRDKLICNISRFVLPEAMSDEECLTLASILHFDHGIPADYVIPFFARHADAETVTGWLSADGKRRYVEWLKSLPYDEYLKTEHWQATRGPILFRDGGRCRLCNSPDNLNVHHRTYERLGEERPEDLTTLCQPCHQAFHDNRRLCNGTAPPGSTASTQQSTG